MNSLGNKLFTLLVDKIVDKYQVMAFYERVTRVSKKRA
jgi:hypothetical protein